MCALLTLLSLGGHEPRALHTQQGRLHGIFLAKQLLAHLFVAAEHWAAHHHQLLQQHARLLRIVLAQPERKMHISQRVNNK